MDWRGALLRVVEAVLLHTVNPQDAGHEFWILQWKDSGDHTGYSGRPGQGYSGNGGKGTGQGMDRARLTLRDDSLILVQEGTSRLEVAFSALSIGQKVEGRISGPVMESYPVQATASGIMILSE